jgi:tetratricopeptide (TPR) repeat protein
MRFISLLVLMVVSLGFAQTVAIYPFSSQETLLGIAVADRTAQGLSESFEVFGPEVTPTLPAPILATEGYYPVLSIMTQNFPIDTQEGAGVLREVLGSDYAITGSISFEDGVVAKVFLAGPDGRQTLRVTSEEDDPTLLAKKVAFVVAARLGIARPEVAGVDLSGPYGDYINAVSSVVSADLESALSILEEAQDGSKEEPRLASLYDAVRAALVGDSASQLDLMAALSLNLSGELFSPENSLQYFEPLAEQSALPVFKTWVAVLKASTDPDNAGGLMDTLANTYPYGRAVRASYLSVNSLEGADAALAELLEQNTLSSLYAASLIAGENDDAETETKALEQMTRVAPSSPLAFETLSFIYFDEDEPKKALEVLIVASRLNPENTTTWTNLGWANYLVGNLAQSEADTLRSIELQEQTGRRPGDYIPWYNLGLVRTVTGRLEEAMDAYEVAVELDASDADERSQQDPGLDDASIEDLVNALEIYPNQPAVHYALANLLQIEGKRDEAKVQFEAYIASGENLPLQDRAAERLEVLNAPLPALEISPGVEVGLGEDFIDASPYHPGDRLVPSFEIYTPGSELPSRVTVKVALLSDGNVLAEQEDELSIPQGAIGFLVSSLSIDLPSDLAEGDYVLELTASASEDRSATSEIDISVAGGEEVFRQLIARNIYMLNVEESNLYSAEDLTLGDSALISLLLAELEGTAELAEEALPTIEDGRFGGKTGGQLFSESTEQDIRDFLTYILTQGTSDAIFGFADAYAQWALEGGPVTE